ncbi:MAG: transcriptional repressor [Bacteroidales bacterium]|jgi:Fur family peroxide stress response transcriptional regulator|nr:transcriptional repressor [Bacteroidales bacterium]
MKSEDYSSKLRAKGLRVTPQRLAVFEAVDLLHDHPTAEEVSQFIRKKHPDIALGTVYKTLETLVDRDILKRVKTDSGLLRYDAVKENHHHIYCALCDRIEDYYDVELTQILYNYFEKKRIPDFMIDDIKLQIVGRYTDDRKAVRKTGKHTDTGNSFRETDIHTDKRNTTGKSGENGDNRMNVSKK